MENVQGKSLMEKLEERAENYEELIDQSQDDLVREIATLNRMLVSGNCYKINMWLKEVQHVIKFMEHVWNLSQMVYMRMDMIEDERYEAKIAYEEIMGMKGA